MLIMPSHQDPSWARRTDQRGKPPLSNVIAVAIFAQGRKSQIKWMRIMLSVHRPARKMYGPVSMPEPSCYLTDRQHHTLYTRHQLTATIKYSIQCGIWVWSPCTRQCRHALARTRCIPSDRHIPTARRCPSARRCTSRRMSNNQSDRPG